MIVWLISKQWRYAAARSDDAVPIGISELVLGLLQPSIGDEAA